MPYGRFTTHRSRRPYGMPPSPRLSSAHNTTGPSSSSRSRWPQGAMGPPRHSHPTQEESWTVQAGELSVLVNNQWRTLAAGESLTIPPATVHTLTNRSAATVRFHDAHRPALDFREYIEDLDRLTRSGKLSTRMTPRTLIYGAMVLVDHRPMQLSASAGQRAAESILAALGRMLGYRVRTRTARRG